MTGDEFVQEMNATIWQLLSVRDAAFAGLKETANLAEMPDLLRCALRHELEATEIAALWVAGTAEIEVKLTFARQAGDEARHYMLVAGRLAELGAALGGSSPTGPGPSKLVRYLEGLDSTVERVAAGLFAREAVGNKSNELFIEFCEGSGDHATAELFRVHIQPDEKRHHEWGRELLAGLALDEQRQGAARKAVLTTLELAEELRSLAWGRPLAATVPGS
jgi:hypothetical protein